MQLVANGLKASPIQEDEHPLTVIRYVDRNPLRANLVTPAEG
jgi:putative transposase